MGTGERNRLAPTGKRKHHTKMKRYDAHCKTILLGKALGRRSLQETARPTIKSKVPTAHNKARLAIAQNTHDQPAQGFSFSSEKQPQTAHGSGTGRGAARLKGAKLVTRALQLLRRGTRGRGAHMRSRAGAPVKRPNRY